MNKFFKTFLTATVLTLANSAFADDCANDLKLKIDFAYNDGGLSVENTVGPIYWLSLIHI